MTGEFGAGSKPPEAFRSISEAAEEIGVAPHVLRFWEGKFPLLKPLKRGGGRRFYRTQDMALLRGLKILLQDEGYTIKGVQKLIRENGIQFIRNKDNIDESGLPEDVINGVDDQINGADDQPLSEDIFPFNNAKVEDGDSLPQAVKEPAKTYANSMAKGNGLRLRQAMVKLEAARRVLDAVLSENKK